MNKPNMQSVSVSIEDRLYTVKYRDANESHLGIADEEVCRDCGTYECVSVCPAEVWEADTETGTVPTIAYENCLECGSCRFACSEDNVEWTYPNTGGGVVFKNG